MIILLTLILSIPGTAVTIGFNSMFADLVPVSWRGYVAGIRNSVLSAASTLTTLLSGWILVALPFPLGYQIRFWHRFFGGDVKQPEFVPNSDKFQCPNHEG